MAIVINNPLTRNSIMTKHVQKCNYFISYIGGFYSSSRKKYARAASRQYMYTSYEQMMDKYSAQQKHLAGKPGWVAIKTAGSVEPKDMTVTHINQTRDLMVCFIKLFCFFSMTFNTILGLGPEEIYM